MVPKTKTKAIQFSMIESEETWQSMESHNKRGSPMKRSILQFTLIASVDHD